MNKYYGQPVPAPELTQSSGVLLITSLSINSTKPSLKIPPPRRPAMFFLIQPNDVPAYTGIASTGIVIFINLTMFNGRSAASV